MSILNITLNTNEDTHHHDLGQELPEYLEYNEHLKNLYGEVNTPYSFIYNMLSIIPEEDFKNKNLKWLDAGAGHGNYSICLFIILFILPLFIVLRVVFVCVCVVFLIILMC